MDLLNDIMRNPIDPDYHRVAAEGRRPRASRPVMLVVALAIGALFSVSAVQTTRSAPAAALERDHLIQQVRTEGEHQDVLRGRIEQLRTENDRIRSELLTDTEEARLTQDALDRLGPIAGHEPVQGPGVVIVVDDAPAVRDDKLNRVLDKDLQVMANGLWLAGAEAVAINGHRLSSLTAIRSAGDAITVDYRSITRPYRVEAIGDPRTLAARFVETPGGQLWQGLEQNYEMRFDLSQADRLDLRADPGLGINHARRTP